MPLSQSAQYIIDRPARRLLKLAALLLAGMGMLLLSACDGRTANDLPAILEGHAKAVGTLPDGQLLALEAVVQKADYDVQMRVYAQRPDSIRYDWVWDDGYHFMASDGDVMWEDSSKLGGPRQITDAAEVAWMENVSEWLVGVRPLKEIVARGTASISLVAPERSDRPDLDHLILSYRNGNMREVFLSRDTHLIAMIRQDLEKDGDLVTFETTYSDYRQVGSVMVPGKLVERRGDEGAVLSTLLVRAGDMRSGSFEDLFKAPDDLNML